MLTFPDVSNYQAGLSLAGAQACIAKASEGTSFVDHTYAGFRDQAHAMGIPFAGYHYLHHESVESQAHFALSIVGPGTPLMLDVEVVSGGQDPQLADVYAFIDAYRAAGGTLTLAYIPQWFWRDHWGSPSMQGLIDRGVALISSNYTDLSTGAGWHPYGGVTPLIWQYTSTQPFNGYSVDFNAFQGTQDELRTLFNGKPSTVEGKMITIVPGPDAHHWWKCDGMFVQLIDDENLAHTRYLASQGAIQLWHDPKTGSDVWNGGLVPAFGVDIATLVGSGTAAVDTAAIAKAVNDDAAARLAE